MYTYHHVWAGQWNHQAMYIVIMSNWSMCILSYSDTWLMTVSPPKSPHTQMSYYMSCMQHRWLDVHITAICVAMPLVIPVRPSIG